MREGFRDVRRVLLIKLRHIGDVLITVPSVRAVREAFPEAHIAALVNRGTEEMLSGNPLLDEVIVYDRGVKELPPVKRMIRELDLVRKIRGKAFDMAIDFTSGDRGAIISFLSGARYRVAFDPEGQGFLGKGLLYTHPVGRPGGLYHAVLQNLYLVREVGFDTDDLRVEVHFSREDDEKVEGLLSERGVEGDFVHIHPTSRWFFKCWRDDYMAEVMDWFEGQGLRVVVTSSPERREVERVRRVLSLTRSRPVDLSGLLTLKELSALAGRALLFFGVDSAPMHIAAAMDTPVIALFGPSGAFEWGPWDNSLSPERTPYPRRNGVQRSGLHTVIQKDWDCVPCGKDGCDGSKRSRCLEEMGVGEVIGIIEERLGEVTDGKVFQSQEQGGRGPG